MLNNKQQTLLPTKKVVFGVIFLLTVAACIHFLSQNQAAQNTIVLATTKKPETFTELYFSTQELPTVVSEKGANRYYFNIHNLENRDFTYEYQTYVLDGLVKTQISSGRALVRNGETKTIAASFSLKQNKKNQIVVELLNKNQSIHFWTEKIN